LDLAGQFELQQARQNDARAVAGLLCELVDGEINGLGKLPHVKMRRFGTATDNWPTDLLENIVCRLDHL
jgi:hypothetical protein